MKLGSFLLFILLPFLSDTPQSNHKSMTGSATKNAESSNMHVAPDLNKRLAKFVRVQMPYHSTDLTPREQKMVEKLVEASRYLEDIYWRQSDPEGLELYQTLEASKDPKDEQLRRYLWINSSRYDLFDGNRSFVGNAPISPGRGFYPQGLTQAQVEQYVKEHPEKKDEIYSSTTIVRWHNGQLEGVPYHIAYRSFLEPAARDLREAASLSEDASFANFLRLRADALLSDDYLKSDQAWIALKDPKIDLIFAPYETYDDGLLGVKATYGAAILVRNVEESRKLALFQKYVHDIQDSLPLAAEDRPSKTGLETPMQVVDAPFRSGDLNHGYQAVADNLPNDPRIHEESGSKKIFFKNFMDARVHYVILPVVRHVMVPNQATKVTADGYMVGTILHEMAHGLGPAYARTASGKVEIRESLGTAYSAVEEAKADVVGMVGVKWLVDHQVLPKNKLDEYYASFVADMFRTARFGMAEAHAQAEVMEFNYLAERGAIKRHTNGRYSMDFVRLPDVLNDLAKELLQQEVTGDRQRAENWLKRYSTIPPELEVSLRAAADVPLDISPVYSFPDRVR